MSSLRTVHVLSQHASDEVRQGLYLDNATGQLRPNRTFVNDDGNVLFETNSLGLRGPEPVPGRSFAVVWGDSVVFSIAVGPGWPELINDDSIDCIFANGGLEGATYQITLKRALSFNRRHPGALNVLLLGWFPFPGNRAVRDDLENALTEISNPILVTQPTCLNESISGTDLRPFFRDGNGYTRFNFWPHLEYSVDTQLAAFNHICERNAIVREVAASTRTPLIDLFELLDSRQLADFREDFFDISHMRISAYAKAASLMREAIRPLLQRAA